MYNQNSTLSAHRTPPAVREKQPASAVTEHAPRRRWSVAELILQATLLEHPATASACGA